MIVAIAMAACVHLAGKAEMFTPLRQTLRISFCKVACFSPSLFPYFCMLLLPRSDLCSLPTFPFAIFSGIRVMGLSPWLRAPLHAPLTVREETCA